MKTMSRLWTLAVVGAVMGATLFWATPAKAAPLTKVDISWEAFSGSVDLASPVVPELFQAFDFDPATLGGDGEIYSQVFWGVAEPFTDKFVYVYQIDHYPGSSSPELDEISFKLLTTIPPDLMRYFVISSWVTPPTIGFGPTAPGVQPPYFGEWTPNPPVSEIGFKFENPNPPDPDEGLRKGETSYLFVFVHPLPPTTVAANLVDAGPDLLRPLVYTPSPEPSTIALLSMGLLGFWGYRRRKSRK